MIIETKNGRTFNTATDLTSAERHILQKLFLWESMAVSTDEFRGKVKEALLRGWADSGPVTEREAMKEIVADLEQKVALRVEEPRGRKATEV